jgi:uncharacterized protein YndB with AHSA1/START domain
MSSTKQEVTVQVTHRYSASPERVFDAWLDPKLLDGWMFGASQRDEEVVSISVDARVGGSFSFLVRRQGQEIDHVGEYLEIDRPRRLAFTWGAGASSERPDMSRVSIDISANDSGCELTLMHELQPDWADYADRNREGWTKILDALEKAVS